MPKIKIYNEYVGTRFNESKSDELVRYISKNNLEQIKQLFRQEKDLDSFLISNYEVLFKCLIYDHGLIDEHYEIANYFLENVFNIDTVPLILKELIEFDAASGDFYSLTLKDLVPIQAIEYVLKKGFPVNQLSYGIQDSKVVYRTALDHARLCFHEAAVKLLLEYNAKSAWEILGSQFVNPSDYEYHLPCDIRRAISDCNLPLLQEFIGRYPDVNWNKFMFASPMSWACNPETEIIAKFLLDYVDLALDKTILLEILESEYEKWVDSCFAIHVDEEFKEQGPETKWLEFALQHGADVNHILSPEKTSIYTYPEGNLDRFSITTVLDRALELGLDKIATLFRQYGAKTLSELLGTVFGEFQDSTIRKIQIYNESVVNRFKVIRDPLTDELFQAISDNNLARIMQLFSWRKDLSHFRASNHNVLLECLTHEHFEIADFFLDNLFSIDTSSWILKEFIESEAMASINFFTETVQEVVSSQAIEYILKKDFPVNQLGYYTTDDGKIIYRTALDYARLCFHETAVKLLSEYKAKSALEILGDRFVSITDYEYHLPLDIRWAITQNNLPLLQQFVDRYPEVNWHQCNTSPMAWACIHHAESSVQFWLDYMDLSQDKTLLLEILESEYEAWSEGLFFSDTDETATQQDPQSKWLEFALQHGAKVNHILRIKMHNQDRLSMIKGFEMTTVLDKALELGLSKIVALFRRHGAKTLSELLGHE